MSIRLTNEMRATIESAIYKATTIPGKLEELEKQLKKCFTAWAKSQVPKDFIDATKHLPKNWLPNRGSMHLQYGTSFQHPEYSDSSWTHSMDFNDPIQVPNDFQFPTFTRTELKKHPEIENLLVEVIDWKKKGKATKQELKNTLKAYNTVDKLLKDFPEFAKHCPEKPVYALAVNPDRVALNLMNVGFDITVKPVKTASTPAAKVSKPRVKKVKA